MTSMTRTALRSGAKTFRQVLASVPKAKAAARPKVIRAKRPASAAGRVEASARPSAARPSTRADRGESGWSAGVAIAPAGVRRYRLYKPPGTRRSERLPLLVMLHGCGQDAAALAASSGMNRLARTERFLVLYPEQDRLANSQGCWNWFDTRNGRAQREAAIIDAAIEQVCIAQPVDRARIAIAGLSAGPAWPRCWRTQRPERFLRDRDALGHRPGPRAFVGDGTERDAWPAQVDAAAAVSDRRAPVAAAARDPGQRRPRRRGRERRRSGAPLGRARAGTNAPSRVVQRGTRHAAR
jgi:poly(3-hydroxybutyrate) depolymerase